MKICPYCKKENQDEAKKCECGYCFDKTEQKKREEKEVINQSERFPFTNLLVIVINIISTLCLLVSILLIVEEQYLQSGYLFAAAVFGFGMTERLRLLSAIEINTRK